MSPSAEHGLLRKPGSASCVHANIPKLETSPTDSDAFFFHIGAASLYVLASSQTPFYIIEETTALKPAEMFLPGSIFFSFSPVSHCPLFDTPHRRTALLLYSTQCYR